MKNARPVSQTNVVSSDNFNIPSNIKKNVSRIYEGWKKPEGLECNNSEQSYPVHALPEEIRSAVKEVQEFVQAPLPLIASCALSALSIAGQAHLNVRRAEKLVGPSSLYLLTIADSGERKSTCDRLFMKPIEEYEQTLKEKYNVLQQEFEAKKEAWESRNAGIKEQIRRLSIKEESTQHHEDRLKELEFEKPRPPLNPKLIYEDETTESLTFDLATKWPSGGLISSEAGIIFGSHSMSKDSQMRNMATLNKLWDGGNLTIGRRTSESISVKHARMTIALQVQEKTFSEFLTRSEGLARGIGFLARFLVAFPVSTQGRRFFNDPPETWPALERFNKKIIKILEWPLPVKNGLLSPIEIGLTNEAYLAWRKYHDSVEYELRKLGKYSDIRDFASKSADNAVRIAALFHIFEKGLDSAISLETFQRASAIAKWHLNETLRIFGLLEMAEDKKNLKHLQDWLLDFQQTQNNSSLKKRDLQRCLTPARLRKAEVFNPLLQDAIDYALLRFDRTKPGQVLQINPYILEG